MVWRLSLPIFHNNDYAWMSYWSNHLQFAFAFLASSVFLIWSWIDPRIIWYDIATIGQRLGRVKLWELSLSGKLLSPVPSAESYMILASSQPMKAALKNWKILLANLASKSTRTHCARKFFLRNAFFSCNFLYVLLHISLKPIINANKKTGRA